MFDSEGKLFPQYEIVSGDGQNHYIIRFNNDQTIEYDLNQSGWIAMEEIQIEESNGMSTATFKPIQFGGNGMNFSMYGLVRSLASDYTEFVNSNNSILLHRPASIPRARS
jgi:hypothetical protein